LSKLENTLRYLMGEELITHLGLDYYEDLVKEYEELLQTHS
jgi:myo-inositol-1-phosphate synthase